MHCSVPQQLQEVTRQQVAARVGCFGSAGLAVGVVVVPLMRTAVAIGPEVLQYGGHTPLLLVGLSLQCSSCSSCSCCRPKLSARVSSSPDPKRAAAAQLLWPKLLLLLLHGSGLA